MSSFYLTTPIYYVNSTPHIGHAYTTIAADILVRHHQQRGEDTFFLTGTDEHASKVYRVAEERGLGAKEFVDQIVEENWRPLAPLVGAEPDFFIRTTDDEHKSFVQGFVERLRTNGHIFEGIYSGLYCVGHETFIGEDELVDGKCPEHGTAPEFIEEQNWFFRLSAFQEPLLRLYDERPDFVLPRFRYNEARSLVEAGLEDFSLSRQGQPWGVPIPWDEDQVTWVWVDALINYVSALTYAQPGEDLRDRYWPHARHLLGKDILRLHCVIWPALLLGADYPVPRQLFVHGYLLLDDRKISKTLGNVVDPLELIGLYGADAVRYWAARSVSFGQDGSVSLDTLHDRYERELGNDLGNLLSRTTAMIARYRDGRIPEAESLLDEHAFDALRDGVSARLDVFDITGGLDLIWDFVRSLNKFVTDTKPWELAKGEENTARLDAVLFTLADGLRAAAVALFPYLPDAAPQILAALRQPDDTAWEQVARGRTVAAVGVEAAPPLFPRVEAPATAA